MAEMMICENAGQCNRDECVHRKPHGIEFVCGIGCGCPEGVNGSRCVEYKRRSDAEKRAEIAGIPLPDIDEDQYEYSPVGQCEVASKCDWHRWYKSDGSWHTDLHYDNTQQLSRRPKKKRWRPGPNELYYTASSGAGVLAFTPSGCTVNGLHKSGNCWRTKEQAEKYAEECRKLADWLHEEFGE